MRTFGFRKLQQTVNFYLTSQQGGVQHEPSQKKYSVVIRAASQARKNHSDVRLAHANNRSIQQLRHQSVTESGSGAPESVPVRLASVPPPQRAPTWEAAAPLRAVVRAGGAEILWLVVWDSIRQSVGQSVVGNEKEGYSGGVGVKGQKSQWRQVFGRKHMQACS